jgi:hypothetical protein
MEWPHAVLISGGIPVNKWTVLSCDVLPLPVAVILDRYKPPFMCGRN